MTVDAAIFWLFVLAWAFVLGQIGFVYLPRAVRDGSRLVKRVLAITSDSPLPLQFAKAEGDAARMQRAVGRLPVLQRRAIAALSVIRTTPLVPPSIAAARQIVRAELHAFRVAAGQRSP